MVSVNPPNGHAEKLQALLVPCVGEGVRRGDVYSVVESCGVLERDVASHSGAEKDPIFLGDDALRNA